MSNTLDFAITVTVTGIAMATSGASANATIPLDSAGNVPKYIRVTATAAATVRIGTGTPVALTTDLLVQPGDAVVLATGGCTKIAAIQVTAPGVVQVSPMENA
jgi:hypothetical protein